MNHESLNKMKELPTSNEKYQVYFFTCPAHKPAHFAAHLWVVTVSPNGINRWEVFHKKKNGSERYGYIHRNHYLPTQGLEKSYFSNTSWPSTLIGSIEGDNETLAHNVVEFIETYSSDYLHKDRYRFYPGPNSNTYIAWILSKFPDVKIKLPWNAFGKNYLK